MSKLTKAQRARLEKLAAYLEGLPADYAHFGMGNYLEASSHEGLLEYAAHNGGVHQCGTAACALGHGPAAGILAPPSVLDVFRKHDSYQSWRGWEAYARLFVGGVPGHFLFEWCFGGAWSEVDDTHHGAAARIRYLLDGGEVDGEFESHNAIDSPHFVALYAPYRIDAKQAVQS